MRVVLDSNIIIDFLHGIAEAKTEMLYHADRVISAITWMELMTAFHAQREKGIMKPEDFHRSSAYQLPSDQQVMKATLSGRTAEAKSLSLLLQLLAHCCNRQVKNAS